MNKATLHKRFHYDADTGRLIHHWHHVAGCTAGWIDGKGYRVIRIRGQRYPAAHLIWLYHHGVLPHGPLKRINGDRADDRIENLCEVSEDPYADLWRLLNELEAELEVAA